MIRSQVSFLALLLIAAPLAACGSSSSGDGGDSPAGGGGAGGSGSGGASGGSTTAAQILSGTRLTARFQKSGSAALPIGFYDSMLAQDCDTTAAADGVRRCLPGVISSQVLYLDAGCSQPAIALSTCEAPGYARLPSTSDRCSPGDIVRSVTGKAPPGALFSKGSQGCGPATVAADATIFALGDEVPAAMFVGVKSTSTDPRGATLAAQLEVFDDGASQTTAILDVSHGSARCSPADVGSPPLRCLPSDVATLAATGTLFSDSACASPVGMYSSCGAAAPSAILKVDAVACGMPVSTQIFGVGAAVTMPFTSNGGSCHGVPAGDVPAFAAGPESPASSYPPIPTVPKGDGRVQLEWATAASGEPLFAGRLYDTKLAVACRARVDASGASHCLPVTTLTTGVDIDTYADAACMSQPVLVLPEKGCGDSEGAPTHVALAVFAACAPTTVSKMWSVTGAPRQLDTLYTTSSGGCMPQGFSGLVLDVSPLASFDDFAVVTSDP